MARSKGILGEALYLRAPDNSGVVLYWDRSNEKWPRGATEGRRCSRICSALKNCSEIWRDVRVHRSDIIHHQLSQCFDSDRRSGRIASGSPSFFLSGFARIIVSEFP